MKTCLFEVCQTKWKLWRALFTHEEQNFMFKWQNLSHHLPRIKRKMLNLFFLNDKTSWTTFRHPWCFRFCQFGFVSSVFFSVHAIHFHWSHFSWSKYFMWNALVKQKQLKSNSNKNTEPQQTVSPSIANALILSETTFCINHTNYLPIVRCGLPSTHSLQALITLIKCL